MAARPLYNDIHLGFLLVGAIHVLTTRITYTVPAGRIATLTYGSMSVAEPAGLAFNILNVNLTINGAIQSIVSNVGVAQFSQFVIGSIDLSAGDIILISSVQAAGGGFVYSGNLQIREYQ